jgi:hypothetical protein
MKHPRSTFDCRAPMECWRVIDRNCNYSSFNGRRYTPSDYSLCKCLECGALWRTKAKYVAYGLRDATPGERRD